MAITEWSPIENLQDKDWEYSNPDLQILVQSWIDRLEQLKDSEELKEFNQRLSRQWAIETGIVERVYSLDRGITQLMIEKGIIESLIPHGSTDKPKKLVVSIIQDQKEVVDGLFDLLGRFRRS